MLSVINRGTTTQKKADGLPFEIHDGYIRETVKYKLIGVPPVLSVNVPIEVLNEYIKSDSTKTLGGVSVLSVDVNPIIKNGYEPKENG